MKKILLLFVFIFLTVFASQAKAAEGVLVDPLSTAGTGERALPSQFSLVVTGSGKLVIKPGIVFTEGTEAQGTELPYLLDHPKPISYPRWAVSQGFEGKLVIAIEIREDGTVGFQNVMVSTGHNMLDKEAAEAVQTWKFHPAMKDGEPVRTCIQIPITFQLNDE